MEKSQSISTTTKKSDVTKKQENTAHSKEQEKLAENIPEEAQSSDLLHKDIKTTLSNMLKELKENMDKVKEIRKTMY